MPAFRAPGSAAAAAGSWAAEQMMRAEARGAGGGEPAGGGTGVRGTLRAPEPLGERPTARLPWTGVLG